MNRLKNQTIENQIMISLNSLNAAFIGFLLIFSSPFGAGYFANWLIPIIGSYRISIYELFSIIIAAYILSVNRIRIKKHEQFIFNSIMLIIISRLMSLIFAEKAEIIQIVSVSRYLEALVLIYTFTILFSKARSRSSFIIGLIIGVSIETIMGIFLALNGEKGVFIGITTSQLQVYFIIVLLITYISNAEKYRIFILIMILIIGLVSTQSRTALLQLFIVLLLLLWYLKKQWTNLKPILILLLTILLTTFLLIIIFPSIFESIFFRINAAINGDGATDRWYLFDKSISYFLKYPITGVGSGGFTRLQINWVSTFNYNWSESYLNLDNSTHNTFLGVICETGIVGVLAYFFWLLGCIVISFKILYLAVIKNNEDKFAISAALMTLMYVISDFVGQNSFYPISITLLGFMLGWLRAKQISITTKF